MFRNFPYRTQLKHVLKIKEQILKFPEMTRKFTFLLAFKMTTVKDGGCFVQCT